ncbi:hypothetical protein ACX1C1_22245 [Paenibacillus sp. strain BS8-2]
MKRSLTATTAAKYGYLFRLVCINLFALVAMFGVAGCAADADSRTPEEWLSMAYSGLAAMDQYHFTGSVSMGMDEAVMSKPQMFEGKVMNHEQLTVQSDETTPVNWNPVDVLAKLSSSNAGVEIIDEGMTETESGASQTLTIQVNEQSDITTKRWDSLLRQQFQEVAKSDLGRGSTSEDWRRIVSQSQEELNEMLAKLEVKSQYDIVIDKQRLLPLKMEEHTQFSYLRGGHPVSESRYTAIRFQRFEGSANEAVN